MDQQQFNLDQLTPEALEQSTLEAANMGDIGAQRAGQRAQIQQAVPGAVNYVNQFAKAKQVDMQNQMVKNETAKMKESLSLQQSKFDKNLAIENKLDKIEKGAKQRLVDAEMQFKEDSFGRKMLTERQLIDWANTKALGEQDWANFQQRTEQLHKRKIAMLEASFKKLEQLEIQAYKKDAAALDRQTREALAKAKANLERKLQKEKAKAANTSALISGMSTVGAVAGTAIGGPMGGAGGAVLGTVTGKTIGENL